MRTLKRAARPSGVRHKSVHEIDYEYIFIATLDPDILSIAKIMLKQMKVLREDYTSSLQ